MFSRGSISSEVASAVMYAGELRGHTVDACGFEMHIREFLGYTPSAATVGGWLEAARIHQHRQSAIAMAFMVTHKYLRDLFPDDILEEMFEVCLFESDAAQMVLFVLGESPILSETQRRALPDPIPAMQSYYAANHWADLVGDF